MSSSMLMAGSRRSFEFFNGLWEGDPGAWTTLGIIVAIIIGLAVAEKVFGFKIPTRKERHRAGERKFVLFKYERD